MNTQSTDPRRINPNALFGALFCTIGTFSLGLMMLAGSVTIA